ELVQPAGLHRHDPVRAADLHLAASDHRVALGESAVQAGVGLLPALAPPCHVLAQAVVAAVDDAACAVRLPLDVGIGDLEDRIDAPTLECLPQTTDQFDVVGLHPSGENYGVCEGLQPNCRNKRGMALSIGFSMSDSGRVRELLLKLAGELDSDSARTL